LDEIITLSHGSGGRKMQKLISGTIMKYLDNPILRKMDDSAVLLPIKGRLSMTTDSFVVSPLFFSGGDIGRLAVCGTVNDLTAVGAKPKYLTAGLIIEEGFRVADLERILLSMKIAAEEAGVIITAGDTKVVERGKADGIFINTSGLGEITSDKTYISAAGAKPGDAVIISGTIGDHEIAILKQRKGLGFDSGLKSDCAPLNNMLLPLIKTSFNIHVMRDPTRGGLAAVLNEIASASGVDIRISNDKVPVNKTVRSACSIFGFDPLYLANEGKMTIICADKSKNNVLKALKQHKYGRNAAVIGKVLKKSKSPKVLEDTTAGGERIIFVPEGEMLPRIC
jgi:hydrogenase expression/formation protein HypE